MGNYYIYNKKKACAKVLLFFTLFLIPHLAQAAQIGFEWDANPQAENITGYKLYFGEKTACGDNSTCQFDGQSSTKGASPISIADPDQTSYTLDGLDEGAWCFKLAAYSGLGESSSTTVISEAIDTINPSISITSPTSSSEYTTGSNSINIGGIASDNLCIDSITWTNDEGGNGTATGTTSWSESNITLQQGDNVITFTATDSAGNTATDIITVTYENCVDADGDGYCSATDCNDANSAINPGATEICDGSDNDCDGQTDEALTQSCGSDVGACQSGTQTCSGGSWGSCAGGVGPTAEICDGQDNDCDERTDERCDPPIFDVDIDLNANPIKICFVPDQPLDADPIITLVTGNGAMNIVSGSTVSPFDDPCSDLSDDYSYCIDYTIDNGDTVVEINIDEDPNNPIIPGTPGFEIAYFTIDSDHERASSFYLYNADGGMGYLKDSQCNETVTVETDPGILDLSNSPLDPDDYVLVEIADIDPAGVQAVDNTMVTGVCDITLSDGVEIMDGNTMTITLSITIPDGWSRQEFLDNLQVQYYDENLGGWSGSGISDIVVDFGAMTVSFSTSHLSIFAASSKQNSGSGANAGDGGGGGGGGGGCSIAPNAHNMTNASALANIIILLLPLLSFGKKKVRQRKPT